MDFEASGFFALRTPLLPFEEFERWSSGLQSAQALQEAGDLEHAIARDRCRLREWLLEIYRHPEMRETLFVSSPHLEETMRIWEEEAANPRSDGIERALTRYLLRSAVRPTPFGLCAGCSVGKVGTRTRFLLAERASYRRQTRLDIDYLSGLCDALTRDPEARKSFLYRRNSSLHRAAGRLHYLEGRLKEKEKERSYHLVALDETDALASTLARAETGASFTELAADLVDEEVTLTEAEDYITELIDNQVLVPEEALRITGPSPAASFVERLLQSPATSRHGQALESVCDALAGIDRQEAGLAEASPSGGTRFRASGLGTAPNRYREIAHRLESLPGKVDLSWLYQVDMMKPVVEATLAAPVVREIMRGIEILRRMAAPRDEARDELKRFRAVFSARYEEREVPLTDALDPEAGLGFPLARGIGGDASPLLRELEFPSAAKETAPWAEREKFLLQKLGETLARGAEEMVLEARDLEGLAAKDPLPLPDAFAVMAAVASSSEEALTAGDFRVRLDYATGPSGARLLGRFCHADKTLEEEVARHLAAEEALRPDAIFAEIVHLPQGRAGNVLARPILRQHEISFLGSGGGEFQIPVSDLRLSVRQGRFVLRSARLEREIIPRLTSAHNFSFASVGLYHFLALLQGQGVASQCGWSWGVLESAPFLPRVATGKLVLSRARWRLHKDEIKTLTDPVGAARYRAVQAWRKLRRLPRLALVAEGDNEFPIDFDNVLSVETLLHLMKGRDGGVLLEMFPGPDQLCARGPEGRFVHELIVPFVRKPEPTEQDHAETPITVHRSPITISRTFPPGSEWLYAKFYCGEATADHVLREVVRPVTARALESGAAQQWFFIRYGDPDWNLRVRLRGAPERLLTEVAPAIHAAVAPLLRDGRAWRVQFDTYEREVERYGGMVGVELAEKIFHVDSDTVLEILEKLEPGDAGLDERWRLALCGTDLLLDDLQLGAEAKLVVLQAVRASFAREFRAQTKLRKQIGERFRKERKDLEALLDASKESESTLAAGLKILCRRSERLAPIMAELRACAAENQLAATLAELAPS